MLTVRKVMELDHFQRAKIITGKNNIDRKISYASVMEAMADDVRLWLREDELLITTFYSVADDLQKQLETIRILVEHRCAGLVIGSIGYWLKEIPPDVIRLADELDLPLIVMPPEYTFHDMLDSITQYLVEIQNQELRQALEIQKKICALLIAKKEKDDLLMCINSSVGKHILFFDSDDTLTYSKIQDTPKERGIRKILDKTVAEYIRYNEEAGVYFYFDGHMFFPLISFGEYYGVLVIVDVAVDECESISLMVSPAVLAFMLVCTKKTKISEKYMIGVRNFYSQLLDGKFSTEQEIYKRMQELGIELGDMRYLILIENRDPHTLFNRKLNFLIKQLAQNDCIKNEVIINDNFYVILLHHKDVISQKERIHSLAGKISVEVKNGSNQKIIMGVSKQYNSIDKISDAFVQAQQAIRVGRAVKLDRECIYYENLGVYGFLANDENIALFNHSVAENLDKLIEYDQVNKTELLETFKILLQFSDSLSELAKDIHVHRNTLFYRKKRIIEVLGENPFAMPQKLNYEVYMIMKEMHTTGKRAK